MPKKKKNNKKRIIKSENDDGWPRLSVLTPLYNRNKWLPVMMMNITSFDYDKNKNYRFLVTQGKSLLMYDGKGKRVKGFSYTPDSGILNAPQHIRYNGKDYIVFAADNDLKILNLEGKKIIESKNIGSEGNYFIRKELPAGIYFAIFSNNIESHRHKFVIKN